MQQSQRVTDDRITLGGPPGRRVPLRAVEPGPQCAHQHPVQQSVQHHLLTGDVQRRLGGQLVQHRIAVSTAGQVQHRGQRVQQAAADLAPHRVGADHQGGGPGTGRAVVIPADPVPGAAVLGFRAHLPARDRLRGGVQIVDEGERVRPLHHDGVTIAQLHGGAVLGNQPTLAVENGAQRQRRTVHETQGPGRGQLRAAEQRAVGTYAAAQVTEYVHASRLDEFACNPAS